jgi:hypothetical protein
VTDGLTVEFGDKKKLKVVALGTAELNCITPIGIQKVLLEGVRFVPGAGVNLVSLTKILDKGAQVKGAGKEIKLLLNGKFVLQALNVENMLVIQEEIRGRAFAVSQRESAVLWHNRFGHAGYDALAGSREPGGRSNCQR